MCSSLLRILLPSLLFSLFLFFFLCLPYLTLRLCFFVPSPPFPFPCPFPCLCTLCLWGLTRWVYRYAYCGCDGLPHSCFVSPHLFAELENLKASIGEMIDGELSLGCCEPCCPHLWWLAATLEPWSRRMYDYLCDIERALAVRKQRKSFRGNHSIIFEAPSSVSSCQSLPGRCAINLPNCHPRGCGPTEMLAKGQMTYAESYLWDCDCPPFFFRFDEEDEDDEEELEDPAPLMCSCQPSALSSSEMSWLCWTGQTMAV